MLAGMQSEVDSMFPTLRDLTPSDEDIEAGAKKLKFGRIVKLTGYHTEIFDMHQAKDLKAYNARMLDLSQRAQIGTVRILVHDRQLMSRKDGSTGWFGYLEWMEYERAEKDDARETANKEGENEKDR